ncbi:MAG: outer membrane beta-barrel protein [Bacteroidales bacterium]
MFNRTLLFLLLLVISTTSFAQQLEMGLTMGSTGYTTTNSRAEYYNTSLSNDLDFGLTLSIPISTKSIYIQPELNFTRRSAETSIGSINNVRAYSEALEIPLLFCFRKTTQNEKLSLYGCLGPNLSMVYKQQLIAPASATLPPTQETSFSLGDIYKIGGVAEIGIRWERSEKRAFAIGLRSSYDAKAITKTNNTPSFKFRAITIKAGYIVKF